MLYQLSYILFYHDGRNRTCDTEVTVYRATDRHYYTDFTPFGIENAGITSLFALFVLLTDVTHP